MDLGTLNGYELLCVIGQGQYGTAYKARHVASGRLFCLKRIPMNAKVRSPSPGSARCSLRASPPAAAPAGAACCAARRAMRAPDLAAATAATAAAAPHAPNKTTQQDDQRGALREAQLLSTLDHPNVIAYRETFLDGARALCIVTGYCEEGDLFAAIRRKAEQRGAFSEDEVMDMFIQIASGARARARSSPLPRAAAAAAAARRIPPSAPPTARSHPASPFPSRRL